MTIVSWTKKLRFCQKALAVMAGLSLAACEPAPAADPCIQDDPGKRGLVGSYVRQLTGAPKLELLQVTGLLRRNGRLFKIFIGDDDFDARRDRDSEVEGALKGPLGARAVPIDAFRDTPEGIFVYDFNYREPRQPDYHGMAILGVPTKPSSIPDNGSATHSGKVLLRITDLTEGSDQTQHEHVGRATVEILHGSKIAHLNFSDFVPKAPFDSITWKRIKVCGARVASSGAGGFQLLDDKGEAVVFAGASDDSPAGTAIIDGRFFGADAGGKATGIGGGILIQGDLGLISGVFVTNSGG